MFGGSAFSELAFCEQDHVTADSSAFAAFLAQITEGRCWLLEIDALSLAASGASSGGFSDAAFGELGFGGDSSGVTGGAVTLRYSSHGWTRSDTGNEAFYAGRIKSDLQIVRNITGRDGIGGLARVFAEVVLSNGDGGLDGLETDYAIDGRAVRLLIGPVTGDYSDFGLVFSGVLERCTTTLSEMRLSLSDGLARLQLPVQENRYAGSGGTEGGADLKGKPKPLCYGEVFNITPPLVDAANLIYQVHDGAISDVPAVRDRAVALTKVVGTPAPGEYSVDTAAGTFTLGASPAGEITCDVLGDTPTAGYTDRTGSIALRILSLRLTTSDIDTTSFANLNGAQPASVGIWIGAEERTAADALDELLAGIGAFGGFSRAGVFTVGRIDSAEGVTPVAEYDVLSILTIERQPLPTGVDPICWRVSVGYRKNYTVQTDVAAGAADADRTFAAEPQRVSSDSSAAIKSQHLLARDYGPVPGLFADEADADTEAARLFDLWGTPRAQFQVLLPLKGMLADIGSVVTLTHPRHRLQSGRAVRVVGQAIRGTRTELRVIG